MYLLYDKIFFKHKRWGERREVRQAVYTASVMFNSVRQEFSTMHCNTENMSISASQCILSKSLHPHLSLAKQKFSFCDCTSKISPKVKSQQKYPWDMTGAAGSIFPAKPLVGYYFFLSNKWLLLQWRSLEKGKTRPAVQNHHPYSAFTARLFL